MTDAEIIAAYFAEERRQAKTVRGQDPSAIIDSLAAETGRPRADLVRLILDSTILKPN